MTEGSANKTDRLQTAGIVISLLIGASGWVMWASDRNEGLSDRVTRLEERQRPILEETFPTVQSDVSRLSELQELQAARVASLDDRVGEISRGIDAISEVAQQSGISTMPAEDLVDAIKLAIDEDPELQSLLQGPEGAPGPTGPPGEDGSAGAPGIDGASNSLAIEEIEQRLLALEQQSGHVQNAASVATAIDPTRIYGSGECVDFEPGLGVLEANIDHGAAICVNRVPIAAIAHTNGCSYVSFTGIALERRRSVDPGETMTFSYGGNTIGVQLGCRREAETDNAYYPVRIFTQ
ncbi:MAG: hypothetical protein AAGA70_16530 [Pseudomonadota bacterium]